MRKVAEGGRLNASRLGMATAAVTDAMSKTGKPRGSIFAGIFGTLFEKAIYWQKAFELAELVKHGDPITSRIDWQESRFLGIDI